LSFASAVQQLTDFPAEIQIELEEDRDAQQNRDALAVVYFAIRHCRELLAVLERDAERWIIAATAGADGEPHFTRWVVDGIGEVIVTRHKKRTGWDMDALTAAVIARVMDEPRTIYDPDTGELLPYTAIGANLTKRLRECIGMYQGKVTGIRDIGLVPSDFCNEQPGEWKFEPSF